MEMENPESQSTLEDSQDSENSLLPQHVPGESVQEVTPHFQETWFYTSLNECLHVCNFFMSMT